jgi:hypothetical protein
MSAEFLFTGSEALTFRAWGLETSVEGMAVAEPGIWPGLGWAMGCQRSREGHWANIPSFHRFFGGNVECWPAVCRNWFLGVEA